MSVGGGAVALPTIGLQPLEGDPTRVKITFEGILQESSDLINWRTLDPQPLSPVVMPLGGPRRFWRSALP